jgi:hypothetical protein
MESVGIFYGLLFCFTAIWYILWPFGKSYGYLVYFSPFGMYIVSRKIWQPWKKPDIFGYFLYGKVMYYFCQKRVGQRFGRYFYKLIGSPCSRFPFDLSTLSWFGSIVFLRKWCNINSLFLHTKRDKKGLTRQERINQPKRINQTRHPIFHVYEAVSAVSFREAISGDELWHY